MRKRITAALTVAAIAVVSVFTALSSISTTSAQDSDIFAPAKTVIQFPSCKSIPEDYCIAEAAWNGPNEVMIYETGLVGLGSLSLRQYKRVDGEFHEFFTETLKAEGCKGFWSDPDGSSFDGQWKDVDHDGDKDFVLSIPNTNGCLDPVKNENWQAVIYLYINDGHGFARKVLAQGPNLMAYGLTNHWDQDHGHWTTLVLIPSGGPDGKSLLLSIQPDGTWTTKTIRISPVWDEVSELLGDSLAHEIEVSDVNHDGNEDFVVAWWDRIYLSVDRDEDAYLSVGLVASDGSIKWDHIACCNNDGYSAQWPPLAVGRIYPGETNIVATFDTNSIDPNGITTTKATYSVYRPDVAGKYNVEDPSYHETSVWSALTEYGSKRIVEVTSRPGLELVILGFRLNSHFPKVSTPTEFAVEVIPIDHSTGLRLPAITQGLTFDQQSPDNWYGYGQMGIEDVNGDGWADLWVIRRASKLEVYENKSAGVPEPTETPVPPQTTTPIPSPTATPVPTNEHPLETVEGLVRTDITGNCYPIGVVVDCEGEIAAVFLGSVIDPSSINGQWVRVHGLWVMCSSDPRGGFIAAVDYELIANPCPTRHWTIALPAVYDHVVR